jgi:hypothetical protein
MNKRNYYCLVAGLPDIIPDDKKLHFSAVQLRDYLYEELHPSDYEMVKLFYLPWDHENLLNICFKENKAWDIRGNFSQELLELLVDKKQFDLLDLTQFPDYFTEFIEKFHDEEEEITRARGSHFLTVSWYELLGKHENLFVNQVGTYKQNVGNIMVALNGRKFNIPVEEALVGTDDITHALRKSRSRDFGLSTEINDIEEIIQIFEIENILERELRIDHHFWNYLDEISFFEYFTAEKVVAYVLKIFIIERWYVLDKEKGQQMFQRLLSELQSNFEIPEVFAITYGKRK